MQPAQYEVEETEVSGSLYPGEGVRMFDLKDFLKFKGEGKHFDKIGKKTFIPFLVKFSGSFTVILNNRYSRKNSAYT